MKKKDELPQGQDFISDISAYISNDCLYLPNNENYFEPPPVYNEIFSQVNELPINGQQPFLQNVIVEYDNDSRPQVQQTLIQFKKYKGNLAVQQQENEMRKLDNFRDESKENYIDSKYKYFTQENDGRYSLNKNANLKDFTGALAKLKTIKSQSIVTELQRRNLFYFTESNYNTLKGYIKKNDYSTELPKDLTSELKSILDTKG